MSTYEELFSDEHELFGSIPADADILKVGCAIADAIREQTEEFRALRIAMTGADRSFVDTPGRAVYPFCTTCNCHHHPEDDNCILRGGMGAVDITTVRPAAVSQEQNAADAKAAMTALFQDPNHERPALSPRDTLHLFHLPAECTAQRSILDRRDNREETNPHRAR